MKHNEYLNTGFREGAGIIRDRTSIWHYLDQVVLSSKTHPPATESDHSTASSARA
jgi:hypothetical protein